MWLIKSNVPLEHGVEPVCQTPRRLLGIRVKSLRYKEITFKMMNNPNRIILQMISKVYKI